MVKIWTASAMGKKGWESRRAKDPNIGEKLAEMGRKSWGSRIAKYGPKEMARLSEMGKKSGESRRAKKALAKANTP